MLKSRTGTDRSDHTTTWARIAVAEALFTENRVVIPFPFARSTSKYGNSKVAAGTSSTVQMTAPAGPARPNRETRTRHSATRFIETPLWRCPTWTTISPKTARTSRAEDRTPGLRESMGSVRFFSAKNKGPGSKAAPSRDRYGSPRLGDEMARGAGAVELDGVEADAVPALGAHHDLHPSLGRRRILRRVAAGRRDGRVQVQEQPAEVERHGEVRAADLRRLRLRREGDDPLLRRLRRDRERLRHLRVLLLVEDDDRFLAQRIPGRRRAALEGALLDLRVAPHHELRAAAE